MNLNFSVASLLLVIAVFDFKCSGKYVTNNLLNVFPIQKLGTISAHCKLNQTFSKCDENLMLAVDDDSKTFWRGPSLVNGNEFPEVNIEIHFDGLIHIAKFSIDFDGSKHAPALWSLERSTDFGQTWSVWNYFVKDADNCELIRSSSSSSSNEVVSDVDDVICSSQSYLKNQRIVVDLMEIQLLKSNTVIPQALEEWTRVTSIRLHFYEWKVNIKPLRNSKISENYFYAVNEIEILGYCEQNGHFNADPTEFGHQCEHNTAGICCNQCKDGFKKTEWKPYTKDQPFECESCNCNGHSNRCVFDEREGGDICQDCQHNTAGFYCNQCRAGFYRPCGKQWNDTNACQPCDCNAFSLTGNCTEDTGKCECKIGFYGSNCATCSPGYVGYPNCKPCNADGTDISQSKPNECACKPNFSGEFCDKCICSDFNYPYCNEIDRIKNELAKVEDMSNFTENCRSSDFGLSFLHVAAMHDLTDIMNELVQFGADVDSEDNAGQSPIVYGILFKNKKAVTELIRHCAKIKCNADAYGFAPLDDALAVGDKEIIEILKDAGAVQSSIFNKFWGFAVYHMGTSPVIPEKYGKKYTFNVE